MSTFGCDRTSRRHSDGDQLMQVKKTDTVTADAHAQFELGECFRLRRLRHDGAKNSRTFGRKRRIRKCKVRKTSTACQGTQNWQDNQKMQSGDKSAQEARR